MDASFKKALNYSFLLLKYRQRSRFELASRLKEKKFSRDDINNTLKYLEEHNYINDKEFVRLFILSYQNRCWGPKKIFFSLRKAGVSDNLAEEAFKNEDIYRGKVRELIKRKIRDYKKNKFSKLLRYLISKGFSYDMVLEEVQGAGIDRFK